MSSEKEHKLADLDARMRSEWNRRLEHDYRYWMSDGVEDDEQMWKVGERDFQILTDGLLPTNSSALTALDLGCGVGRLLRPALATFGRVIGVDVSSTALEIARDKLADVSSSENLALILGNGHDLSQVESSSVDLAYSFAALGSMPNKVFSNYLLELSRVVKIDGHLAIQLYLGRRQNIAEEDTLSLRSFEQERLFAALYLAGFIVKNCQELILPFEVSDHENGVVAHIITLQRINTNIAPLSAILHTLAIEAEQTAGASWTGSRTEHLMAIARAEQQLAKSDFSGARESLEFAANCYDRLDDRYFLLLDALTQTSCSTGSTEECDFFAQNMAALKRRFSQVHSRLDEFNRLNSSPATSFTTSPTGEIVIRYKDSALDQLAKPRQAANAWTQRSLDEDRARRSKTMLIIGCGSGYHLEEFARLADKPFALFEPRLEILLACLRYRDLSHVIEKLAWIGTDLVDLEKMSLGLDLPIEIFVHPQTRIVSGQLVQEATTVITSNRGLSELTPAIGIVGPIYGGTLPIADYVTRALVDLGQRAHFFNFGNFYQSYLELGRFAREERRLDNLQLRYVELLSDLVLEAVSERPIDILICLAQAPISGRVLSALRERGVITVMWFVEDCGRFTTWRSIARYFDYMFVIQKDNYPALIEQAGAGRVHYLPCGCDPGIHRPLDLSETEKNAWGSDLSFVGAGYNNRRKVFARLSALNFKIWGTEWPQTRPFSNLVQEQGRRISPEDYVKIFCSSKINLNLHSSSERDGVDPSGDFVNPRTFELAASGAFQLVDRRKLLPELFVEGEEIACFSEEKELQEKIGYYLANPTERQKIAAEARKRALQEHSYKERMKRMLSLIYADHYEHLLVRQNNSPWQRTINAANEFPELQARLRSAQQKGLDLSIDALVGDIHTGKGKLSDEESKLLFLSHIKKFVDYAHEQGSGKTS